MSDFITCRTVHYAELSWVWSTKVLHNWDYHFEVNDAVDAKVKEVCKKYDVRNNTSYCCQCEGIELESLVAGQVELAIAEVAEVLKQFNGVESI